LIYQDNEQRKHRLSAATSQNTQQIEAVTMFKQEISPIFLSNLLDTASGTYEETCLPEQK